MFDLKSVDILGAAEKGFDYEIYAVDADGVPLFDEEGKKVLTGMVISVKGTQSREGKQAFARMSLQIEQKRKALGLKENEVPESVEAFEELVMYTEDLLAGYIATLTTGWKGFKEYGKKVEFSKEKAKEIYKAYPFIGMQIQAAVNDAKAMLGNL